MQDRNRYIVVGAVVGFLAAGMLAVPSILPPAFADEEPVRTLLKSGDEIFRKPLDGKDFVKPDWTVEPWVATEALSEVTVKKIGYGRTSYVSIVTTATGTYSTDGLASRHVLYPGIVENPAERSMTTHVRQNGASTRVYKGSICTYTRDGRHC